MTGKQPAAVYNIDGKRLTAAGRIDRRHENFPTQVGAITHVYDTLHKPADKLPWHVWETEIATGIRKRVSRHAKEKQALKRAEIERCGQANTKPSLKLRHKLGIDGKP